MVSHTTTSAGTFALSTRCQITIILKLPPKIPYSHKLIEIGVCDLKRHVVSLFDQLRCSGLEVYYCPQGHHYEACGTVQPVHLEHFSLQILIPWYNFPCGILWDRRHIGGCLRWLRGWLRFIVKTHRIGKIASMLRTRKSFVYVQYGLPYRLTWAH